MIDKEPVGIIGSGGQADEAESFLRESQRVAFRALNKDYLDGKNPSHIDIESPSEEHKNTPVIAAIGAPAIRRALLEQWAGEEYHSIISEHAVVDKTAKIGEGCLIAPRAIITTNVEVGAHSIINIGATISHDCKLGEFVTISPGVNIGGNVLLGDGVFVGIGATIKNGVSVAEGAVIGAGSNVLKSIVEANSVVVGNPAKLIRQNDGWLNEI